jgi:hypothetical protein
MTTINESGDGDVVERIDTLLRDLDYIAREHDSYEYGLPLHGTPLSTLREAVRFWCATTPAGDAGKTGESAASSDSRSCTCHPDDSPPKPCPRKFALSECRAASSAMGDDGWRPIETAPKDGTEILGWREDCGVLMVRYTNANALSTMTDKERDELDEESLFAEDWFGGDSEQSGFRLEGNEVPTHWRPLPADPAAASPSPSNEREDKPLVRCASDRDGDCTHTQCPQLRDNEPKRSGRHCPLDMRGDDE